MTKQRDAEIIAAYQNPSLTTGQVADRFGVTRRTVYNVLDRHGVDRVVRRRGPRKAVFSEAEKALIRQLRGDGWSKERVADRLGTSQLRIREFVRQEGLPQWVRRYDARDRIITAEGYACVLVRRDDPMASMVGRSGDSPSGNRYVLEHRLVIARMLGRPLRAEETVHHINGDRLDNRPENLQLRQGKHGKGARLACAECGSHNLVPIELP